VIAASGRLSEALAAGPPSPGILPKLALAVRVQRSANCQGSRDETRQRR